MSDISLTRPVRGSHSGVLATDHLTFLLAAAAVFLSPYNVFRHPSIYFTAADAVTLLTFLILMVGRRLPVAPFGQLTALWYVGFLAIAFGMAVGGLANQRLLDGADVIAQYAFAMIILPWVLGGREFAQAQRLLLVWTISMVIVLLHGIYLMEIASDPPRNMVSGSGRLSGLVERENALAALAALAIVATMYLSAERVISGVVAVLFMGVLLYGIVLTASNTGLIALASGGVAFTVLQRSTRHFVIVAVLCVLVVVALRIGGDEILPTSFMKRVAGALSSGDLAQAGTFDDRMDLAREGWQTSEDHVLIGLGANGFRLTSVHGAPVHNTYVLLLVEGGLISLLGLCVTIGLILLQGAVLLLRPSTRTLGAMVVAVGVLLAMVLNAFAHIYGRFWIVPLVLVMALASHDKHSYRNVRGLIRSG